MKTAYEVAFKKGVTAKALVSRDGHFLVANEAYCKLLEFSELELMQKRFQDITDPDDISVDEAEAERVASGSIESYEMVKRYITKRKHLIEVRLRVDAVRDEDGNFLCFVSQVTPMLNAALTKPNVTGDIQVAKVLGWMNKHSKVILLIMVGVIAFIGYIIKEMKQ